MNVLIACEESQTVCIEFRNRGHQAFSCDLLPCSGGHPEWHIMGNVLPLLNPITKFDWNEVIEFNTMDGVEHQIDGNWDLIIAHPPCTYLTVTGNKWFNPKYNKNVEERINARQKAIDFFMCFVNAPCDKIAIENPVGIMSTVYRKPDQIIQPYQFGDPHRKATCLWLKGLPKLEPTKIVTPEIMTFKSGATMDAAYSNTPHKDRARERSKTYPGIAKAIAEQWG